MDREIIYLTVTAFPVAVERVIHPELRGRPVVVAPLGAARSIVTALSSEAWNAGIRKGMALAKAMRYCRSTIVLPPNEPLYLRASRAIFKVLGNFSPVLEPSGHGHAYIDITGTGKLFGPPRDTAWKAQKEIRRQLHLDASLGIASNKMVSRIASEVTRPAGLQDVPHGNESTFLSPLPVRLLPGVGPQTERQFDDLNIRIIHDVAAMRLDLLTLAFGRFGFALHQRALGIDRTPVYPMRTVPALEQGRVLPEDSNDYEVLKSVLLDLCEQAGRQMREKKQCAGRMELRIRYADYREDGHKLQLKLPAQSSAVLYTRALPLLDEILKRRTRVRSMNLCLTELSQDSVQLELFADPKPDRRLKLEFALDSLRNRYGASVVSRQSSVGSDLQVKGRGAMTPSVINLPTHCSRTDSIADYRLPTNDYRLTTMFTHLHVHSNYSFCRGAGKIEALVDAALARGMSALALTDINGVYGLVWFLQYAAERGLRPIVGSELRTKTERATLLARNRNGYETLCRIISRRQLEPDFRLSKALCEERENLIVLSDQIPLLSALGRQNGSSNVYVELNNPKIEPSLREFSRNSAIPLVATNDVYFVDRSDFAMHRLLRAIDLNTSLSRIPPEELVSEDHWLKPEAAMMLRYPHLAKALENAQRIAEECSPLDVGTLVFPSFDPPGGSDAFEYLKEECYRGAERRYGELSDSVLKRLEHELKIIKDKGFAAYFLIVQDIVKQSARTCGRGSAAASLVSYCLGITHVEPITHNLFFERFLNEGRTDPPDIDIDFPWDERDGVFDYVFRKYGAVRAAMISNHVGFRARAAVREVAKVYGLPEQEIKAVTQRMGYYWSIHYLENSLGNHPVYKDMELKDPWPEIVRLAVKLDGYPRHMSVHCGGIVIVPDRIDRYVPVEPAPKGVPIIQWEKDQAEDAGLIKIDLLGNRSLAVIRDALAAVKENYGKEIDYEQWDPTTDAKTQDLIRRGDTIGVFYVESPSMRQLQQKCQTGDFDHLVIHSSIIRPAANKYIREYVRRLRGGAYQSLHPILDEVLGETYGIMVYQEDVSRIAMAMAGFNASDADLLRKILSKKRAGKKLEDYKEMFYAGAAARNVLQKVIDEVWEMIMSFSGYSFCKPHSASYALVSYKSCYLRAHYPAEFIAAVLTNQGGYYSPFAYVSEARRMGLRVLSPDVNESRKAYWGRDKAIRVGLMQLKGLHEAALQAILDERRKKPFVSLDDFLCRVELDPADVKILIKAGAMDGISGSATRPEMIWKALAWNETRAARRPVMRSLFQDMPAVVPPRVPQYSARTVLEHELETLDFLISRHPLTLYEQPLSKLRHIRGADLPKYVGKRVTVVGWWVTGKLIATKDGEPMEFISFEDTSALYETVFFPQAYTRFCHMLNRSRPYVLTGTVEEEYGVVTLTVDSVRLL